MRDGGSHVEHIMPPSVPLVYDYDIMLYEMAGHHQQVDYFMM
jgi:hypothetical protein